MVTMIKDKADRKNHQKNKGKNSSYLQLKHKSRMWTGPNKSKIIVKTLSEAF